MPAAPAGLFLGTEPGGARVEVAPRELCTHAFCVGMTGSGKTGLCAVLIEEALRQGVPVLAVDPKGDLGNLLLALDPWEPGSFLPWLPPRGAGQPPPDETAQTLARKAQEGLTASGLAREDLLTYRQGHAGKLYTPGARHGVPVDVVGSLSPPKDPGEIPDAVDATVRALLGLVGEEADPVRSREYILLFQLLEQAWRAGQTLALPALVRLCADPPLDTVGALPLEDFYPRKDRTRLVMALNGLLASPPFEAWRTGEPLDIGQMLWTPEGKPRLVVYSTAHLGEEERLFATALLLERFKAWVLRQPGSPDLRALLYLDEIHGYFPPHPYNPPTKKPLLTLLKQARAFGVGVVLATQNPVDLDYKGLSNIGTWFVGRLQTDEDKARIRDGLQGAATSAGQSLAEVERLLSGVSPRVFLHHSIHHGAPRLLHSRWAFSYLRGPLGREELSRLSAAQQPPAAPPAASPVAPAALVQAPASVAAAAPVVGVGAGAGGLDAELGPLYGEGQGPAAAYLLVRFAARYRVGGVSTEEQGYTFAFPLSGTTALGEALEQSPRNLTGQTLREQPGPGLVPATGPGWLPGAKPRALQKVVQERLPSRLEARLWFDAETRLLSSPMESKEAFRARVAQKVSSAKAATDLARKLEKKRLELTHARDSVKARGKETLLSVAGAVFGRGTMGGVLTKNRLEDQAEKKVAELELELKALEADLAAKSGVDPARFEERRVLPVGKDLSILRVAVCYLPA